MSGSADHSLAARLSLRWPPPFLRRYCYWKLRTDPVYAAVCGELMRAAPLPLLDLGCGMGLLAHFLREHGFAQPIRGVDLDASKIALAQQAAQGRISGVEFAAKDFREAGDWPAGHVTLLDVLQFIPAAEQRAFLAAVAGRVRSDGGMLIIRSGIREASWRFRITHLMDRFAKAVRWMAVPPIDYPDRALFAETLGGCGLAVEFRPLWGRTPFNNYLVIAGKSPR